MKLLRNRRVINYALTRSSFVIVFLLLLSGCTKTYRMSTESYQVRQTRQTNFGSNYVICKECVDYLEPTALMQQEELTINNQEEEYEKL